jgi:tRNA1(Val) A37 N6-methylase TrmN6
MSAADTTTDAFLGGALSLTQPARGYRAGIDAVLLAAACTAKSGDSILDCGAGVGTVGLCALVRVPGTTAVLVERAAVFAALARSNIANNGLSPRALVVPADITSPLGHLTELAGRVNSFDHAVANPPFQVDTDGTRSQDVLKDAANAMPANSLEHWLRFMAAMLKPGGIATIIHRVDALAAIIAAMSGRFGGLDVRPIYPRAGQAANRILVAGRKGSRAPLSLLSPIYLHPKVGSGYAPEIEAVLRDGAALL